MSANGKRLLIWLTLGTLLLISLVFLFMPRPLAVDLSAVPTAPMIVTISEEGETRVKETYVLSAPVTGHISRIEAEVGDVVVANDTLIAEIEPIEPALLDARSVAQAEASLHAAEAAEALAVARMEQSQAELEFVESELRRANRLREQSIIAERELETAIRNARMSRAAMKTVTAALDASRFDVERARALLLGPNDTELIDCSCIPVLATTDGQVLQVLRESEGVVTAGEPLLEVGNTSELEILVDLLSTDAVQVQKGQRVIIENWGGEGELSGVVRRVEPYARTKVSALGIEEQRVNVIVDIDDSADKRKGLGHGFQLDVSIVLWEGEDVLQVPLTALFRSGNNWALYVETEGRAVERIVTIGKRNGLNAEIIDGLDATSRIVLYPGNKLADGIRIAQRETS